MSFGSNTVSGSACRPCDASSKSAFVGFSRSGRKIRNSSSFMIIGVSTCEGCTVFTRIESGASSFANVFINP